MHIALLQEKKMCGLDEEKIMLVWDYENKKS